MQTVIAVELVREIHGVCTYNVQYLNKTFTVTNCRGTMNYHTDPEVPEYVLDFVDRFLAYKGGEENCQIGQAKE